MSHSMRSQLAALWPIIRKYKWSFINLFFCILVTSVIGMVYPYIFGLLVDEVFYHRNLQFLFFIVIGYGIIFLSEQSLHTVLNSVWSYLVTRFSFDIRKKLFDKLMLLQPAFFTQSKSGELMAVINRDADEVMNLIHWNIFYLTANSIRLLTAIAFVMAANVYLGLLMLVVVPVVVFTIMSFSRAMKSRLKNQREQYGQFMSWTLEMLAGLRDVRLLAAEKYSTRVFVRQLVKYMRLKNQSSMIDFVSERTISLISLGSDLTLYITASIMIVQGHLTIGAFIAIIEYFSKGSGLLKSMSGANSRIQQNKVSIERVFQLLQEEEEELNSKGPQVQVTDGEIEFKGVSFRYRDETPVLNQVNLVIEGGQTVAIVGKSGGGKSTLISLLLGLYRVDDGDILIDGTSITGSDLKSLRKAVSVSFQEPFLFEGTVRENLLWGSTAHSDDALWAACDKAFITDYVRELPQGLHTIIGGSSGISMSGGQKQRIALARMFLKQPRILVFDEATSALDGEAENVIKDSWHNLDGRVTTIIIAHRLSTIIRADKVAVLDQGRIVAFAHHRKLLAESPVYRQLFVEQYTESEVIAADEQVIS
ncbi:ABC transporter ATP-binding protein [Paenibacillus pedocola]|uniref:ABC transporter ATP-binding protein n=1 Tax=Paenibacillus pedocola TaxID=3242193 RepID=UPI002877A4F3|nr:ABC transporter ATP-binding protein [Paenibacillus typhae]